ncbi:MAG: GNAT family N-acetyltransferase [Candidatus Eremiobacteraeota bacterium]|nr:GNAT family N-acetyltransferase [Candidatus Eremiobacteraeota bacterium]
MLALRELDAEAYAECVLPQTAPLWAGNRDVQTYVTHSLEIARSPYGKRFYRTIGAYDGNLVASFKRYDRTVRLRDQRLEAIGIGAVFTPEPFRGRGYASAMLATALDDARSAGKDLAYLFSDIHPRFYKQLGFVELPSRSISIRADAFSGQRVPLQSLAESDWSGVGRCFEKLEYTRSWSFIRTPTVWNLLRLRLRQGSTHAEGQAANLVVRDRRGVRAYVIGQREPAHDAYVLDEFGYADDAAREFVGGLLRAAAGDLRRIIGWLPPAGARACLPRGSVRKRKDAIFMAAPLTAAGAEVVGAANAGGDADCLWTTDHV